MRKIIFSILLLLCLFHGTVYAETNTGSEKTETVTLTEENRYDPVYYQEPEELYPTASAKMGRLAEISLEDYVVNALENLQTEINVSAYEIPSGEASARYFQILNSHPSLFYVVDSVSWSYNSSTVISYSVQYTDTEENIRVQQEDFNWEVEQALTWVDSSMTDVEKALVVHDYLALDCEYDYERLLNDTLPDISHSAYGALICKKAVCDGYAKAYSCILDKLGISSTIVSSGSMNHAWNMVSIDGEWYHVDATWDDPVWDCIGRVGHNYFLLSDAAISDSKHNHTGWSVGYTADSNTYDSEFWSGITSAFCYQNGVWYYSIYYDTARKTDLVRRVGNLLGVSDDIVYTEEGTWNNYLVGCMYLDLEPKKNEIYFNTRTGIYKFDEYGNSIAVYEPECPEGQLIFGFTVRGSQLCYALQETPNINSKQVVSAYIMEDLRLGQITGITVENLETDYDGTAKQVEIEGTQEGDRITYKHEDDIYRLEQPEMKNVGTYQVSYKVKREGYEDYLGEVQVTIRKGTPKYTLPTGLKGNSGSTLSQIGLPSGFVWEDGAVKLRETGEKTFYVSYEPDDAQNYETVSHIPVTVTVSCSHEYTKNVTVAATVTQVGKAIYTCSLCGHTYDEEIPKLNPDDTGNEENSGNSGSTGNTGDTENTGNSGSTENAGSTGDSTTPKKPAKASGLKVSSATTSSLKFSWKKTKGVKYRLILYKGNKAVSTAYTENSSCTYKKLNAATLYTLKVTPYVENNGKKLYASSSTSIKAATAPAKAKLLSVKKTGSAKAKITWKKVTGADGYEISMRTGKGSYKIIKTITKGKTVTFTKSGLKKGKSYSFRIRAYKKAGNKKSYGSYSNIKTLKIK